MILPLNLNRRHKVTLFLTVLLAGIAALNRAKMVEVVGIFLLGFALAWAFGSDSRVVHWLFLSMGVLLACGTLGIARYNPQMLDATMGIGLLCLGIFLFAMGLVLILGIRAKPRST
jgi:hypothetical protein